MKKKKSASPYKGFRFLFAFGPISDYFRSRRHRLHAVGYRATMQERFHVWNEITGVETAA